MRTRDFPIGGIRVPRAKVHAEPVSATSVGIVYKDCEHIEKQRNRRENKVNTDDYPMIIERYRRHSKITAQMAVKTASDEEGTRGPKKFLSVPPRETWTYTDLDNEKIYKMSSNTMG